MTFIVDAPLATLPAAYEPLATNQLTSTRTAGHVKEE